MALGILTYLSGPSGLQSLGKAGGTLGWLVMGFVLPLSYLTWLPEAAWVGKPQTTFGPQHCLLCLVSQAECDGRKLLPEEATHL